jgi:hypothetical protein
LWTIINTITISFIIRYGNSLMIWFPDMILIFWRRVVIRHTNLFNNIFLFSNTW